MYRNYPGILAALITVGIITGAALEIKQEIHVSDNNGNHKFESDREFHDYMEGLE